MKATAKAAARLKTLMPKGIPKYIRCYDCEGVGDRYTVCFTGKAATEQSAGCAPSYPYRAMSAHPSHPQGIGLWCSSPNQHCDVNNHGFAPAMGRKNHWGAVRIPFANLPPDCQKLVISDYKEIWKLK